MDKSSQSTKPIIETQPPYVRTGRTINSLTLFFERALGYFFPFFLIILESVLRFAFELNTQEFVGPTLAATGVGMTISLTSYQNSKPLEELPSEVQKFILKHRLTIEKDTVRFFRIICWIITLVLTICWIGTIVLSTQFVNLSYLELPAHYILGLISYIFGVILSEIKERV